MSIVAILLPMFAQVVADLRAAVLDGAAQAARGPARRGQPAAGRAARAQLAAARASRSATPSITSSSCRSCSTS